MIPKWIPKLDHLSEAYHYHPHHFTDDEKVPKSLQKDLHEKLKGVVSSKRRMSTLDLRESFKRFQSRRFRSQVPLPLQMLQRDIDNERRRSGKLRKWLKLFTFVTTQNKNVKDTERELERTLKRLKEVKRKCKRENQYLVAKMKLMRTNYTKRCDEISRAEKALSNCEKNANKDTEIVLRATQNARDDMMRAIVPKIHEEVQFCLEEEKKMREDRSRTIREANERVSFVLWRPSFKRSYSRRITIFPRLV